MYPYLGRGDRKPQDFYETPETVTEVLIEFLRDYIHKQADRVLDPACGEGKLIKVFKEKGYNTVASDLFKYKYPYGKYFIDFLEMDSASISWIITNPPFSLAKEFIKQANTLAWRSNIKGYAMLLKSNFWHVKRNLEIIETEKPSFVLPLTWRPNFSDEKKAPVLDMLWTVWLTEDLKSKDPTVTEYRPLHKPVMRKE